MRRKISWKDGRTDGRTEVKQYTPPPPFPVERGYNDKIYDMTFISSFIMFFCRHYNDLFERFLVNMCKSNYKKKDCLIVWRDYFNLNLFYLASEHISLFNRYLISHFDWYAFHFVTYFKLIFHMQTRILIYKCWYHLHMYIGWGGN